ncbi:MAG: ribonuclease HII [Cyanobacteriota bacterium]|nr:ribonuclease HII [Cyanobacteriota bacterium]
MAAIAKNQAGEENDRWRVFPPECGVVAGVDEVGRGALFGPVVAAAVVLSAEAREALMVLGVRDSKKLSAQRRESLSSQIRDLACDCQVGVATVAEIDRLNILQATLLAMRRAIEQLNPPPEYCAIDGNRPVPNLSIPQETIVGGDRTSIEIAAASIVAKVWRDNWVVAVAAEYPEYDLARNKGYGTVRHREALQRYGATREHRQSFAPCRV